MIYLMDQRVKTIVKRTRTGTTRKVGMRIGTETRRAGTRTRTGTTRRAGIRIGIGTRRVGTRTRTRTRRRIG